jgi:hypothetical protein
MVMKIMKLKKRKNYAVFFSPDFCFCYVVKGKKNAG